MRRKMRKKSPKNMEADKEAKMCVCVVGNNRRIERQ